MLIGFVAFLAFVGWRVDTNAYDRGWNKRDAVCVDEKNRELTLLNQENADLINQLNLQKAEFNKLNEETDNETRRKLAKVRADRDAAADDLHSTYRMLLMEAANSGKDESYTPEAGRATAVSRREGTEGSKLAPETVKDIELVSLDGDEAIVLLGSVVRKYNTLKQRCENK